MNILTYYFRCICAFLFCVMLLPICIALFWIMFMWPLYYLYFDLYCHIIMMLYTLFFYGNRYAGPLFILLWLIDFWIIGALCEKGPFYHYNIFYWGSND